MLKQTWICQKFRWTATAAPSKPPSGQVFRASARAYEVCTKLKKESDQNNEKSKDMI